ncbi:MAG TPA: TraB/GumN family protein [Allosphingosinicella sp.]|nr:TraB/GumN family protein [Allosphingosinicella sp.]
MKGILKAGAAAAAALALGCGAAQAQAPRADNAQVEEIVVTGFKSGVPMWTVRSDTTTLVLVGSIEGVSKTTKWDPDALTQALRRADRVMFPQMHAFTASIFSAIGWVAKYNAMGSLPKTQSLDQFAQPAEMQRLSALAARKMVRSDYARRHPLHLARDLQGRAKGEIDYGNSVSMYVRKAVDKYDLTLVPIEKSKAKPLVKDLFASTPDDHLPCLSASIALAEAGPAAVQARSDAWAGRRVQEVLNSPAQAPFEQCWPAEAIAATGTDMMEELTGLLADPRVTLAVLSLRTLAGKDAVLDRLQAAGYDIQGPDWK